jgi:hypothetical protein
MPGLMCGSPEFTRTMANYTVDYLDILLKHAGRNHWLLGPAFWGVLDRLILGGKLVHRRFYGRAEIVALFRRAAPDLVEAEGPAELILNIRARFGFRCSLAILRAAFRGPIPRRFHHLLLPRPFMTVRRWYLRMIGALV